MLFRVSGLESDGSWKLLGDQNIGLNFAEKILTSNGVCGKMNMTNIIIDGKEILIVCEQTTLRLEKPYWGPYN
jgi:hypothetical protein